MATTKKAADEPQDAPTDDAAKDPQVAAQQAAPAQEELAKTAEQADKDRDAVAQAAQEAPGPTVIPANFEDTAAHARVTDAAKKAADAQADDADKGKDEDQPS